MSDVKVTLRVKDRRDGPVIYARWRLDGAQIEKRLGPGWLVRVGEPGAKPNGKTIGGWRERRGRARDGFLTVDAARERVPGILAAYQAEIDRAAAHARRLAAAGVPMRNAVDAWLAWRSRDDPAGEHGAWKHTHRKNMTNYGRRLVREIGEDRRVDSVTADELRTLLVDGLKPMRNGEVIEGRETTRKMRSTYAAALRGIFGYALAQGWTDVDPSADLPAYRARRKRAGDPLRRDEYLTPDELRDVLAQLRAGVAKDRRSQAAREQDAAMAMVMGMAGLRPGEALALRWENVDFSVSALRIVEARSMGHTDTPKSHAGRTMPMADEVARALAALGLREVMTAPRDLVFIGREGGHADLAAFRDRFGDAQDRAGVTPRRDVRQLRNTFGTVCASGGVPLRTLQGWMGHESITTTEIYASFMPRDQDAAMVSSAFAAGTPKAARAAVV